MKLPFFNTILLLAFVIPVLSQPLNKSSCYEGLYREGLQSLDASKYKEAISKFIAARSCPDKPENDNLDISMESAMQKWANALNEAREEAEIKRQEIERQANLIKAKSDSLALQYKVLLEQRADLIKANKARDNLAEIAKFRQERENAVSEAYKLADFSLNTSIVSKKSFFAASAYHLFKEYNSKQFPPEAYTAIYDALYTNNKKYNIYSKYNCGPIRDVLVTDKYLIDICEGGATHVTDLKTNLRKVSKKHNYVDRTLSVSPDEKWLAVGGNAPYTWLFDLKTDFQSDTIRVHQGRLTWDLRFISDSTLISLGGDGKFIKYNLNTKESKTIFQFEDFNFSVRSFIIGPENKAVIYLDQGKLKYFYVENNSSNASVRAQLEKVENIIKEKYKDISITDIAFSKDFRYLILGTSKGEVVTLELASSDFKLEFFEYHSGKVHQVLISEDNRLFASVAENGIVITENNMDKNHFFIPFYDSWSKVTAFDPSGKKIYVGDNKGRIKWWDLRIQVMKSQLCSSVKKINSEELKSLFEDHIGSNYLKNIKPCGISY